MDPSLFITKKAMLLQNFGFLQHPPKLGYIQRLQHWAFYNTKKFKFTNCRCFILDRPRLHEEKLELFGNVLLDAESWLLLTNFICTHLHDGAISVCMHALVGLETLRDWVLSNVQAMGLLFPRGLIANAV